jgi:hypothetical protein
MLSNIKAQIGKFTKYRYLLFELVSRDVKENHPSFLNATRKKRALLSIIGFLGISLPFYRRLKKLFGYKEKSSL